MTRRAGFLGRLDARAAVIERMGGRVRPATEAGATSPPEVRGGRPLLPGGGTKAQDHSGKASALAALDGLVQPQAAIAAVQASPIT